jgi:hypothetical protein
MLGSTTNDENGTLRREAAKFLPLFASLRLRVRPHFQNSLDE